MGNLVYRLFGVVSSIACIVCLCISIKLFPTILNFMYTGNIPNAIIFTCILGFTSVYSIILGYFAGVLLFTDFSS